MIAKIRKIRYETTEEEFYTMIPRNHLRSSLYLGEVEEKRGMCGKLTMVNLLWWNNHRFYYHSGGRSITTFKGVNILSLPHFTAGRDVTEGGSRNGGGLWVYRNTLT